SDHEVVDVGEHLCGEHAAHHEAAEAEDVPALRGADAERRPPGPHAPEEERPSNVPREEPGHEAPDAVAPVGEPERDRAAPRPRLRPRTDRATQAEPRRRIDREGADRGEPDQAELGWRETPREHEHDDVVEADGAPLPQGGPRHAPLGETPQLGGLDAVLDHATASSAPGRAASSTNPAMAP